MSNNGVHNLSTTIRYSDFYNGKESRDCLSEALRWMRDVGLIDQSQVNRFFIDITKQKRQRTPKRG